MSMSNLSPSEAKVMRVIQQLEKHGEKATPSSTVPASEVSTVESTPNPLSSATRTLKNLSADKVQEKAQAKSVNRALLPEFVPWLCAPAFF